MRSRRDFLKQAAGLTAGLGLVPLACGPGEQQENAAVTSTPAEPLFKISLAQWSLHKAIFGIGPEGVDWTDFDRRLHEDYGSVLAGDVDPLDFPVIARRDYGIDAVEYVNTFYFDRARDQAYLSDLKSRADGEGVRSVLIMCDSEGNLGDPDDGARSQAVENHHKWVEAAQFLGCHSIRVNARSDESLALDEQQRLAADGLRRLCEFADGHNINVIVENHGGPSSNGVWLAGVMKLVDHPRVGTLPDFGNFVLNETTGETYDKYKGVTELMPFAKDVSAKTMDFDEDGNCVETDYLRMMKIVLDAGYRGYVGIEYEGERLSEPDGIRATKALLDRVLEELTPMYV